MVKHIKRIVLVLVLCIVVSGCSDILYPKKDKKYIVDYRERTEILKSDYPEVYKSYMQGTVMLMDVYTYKNKHGKECVGITYYKYDGKAWEYFEE